MVGNRRIGNGYARKAPFLAQYLVEQSAVRARPGRAYAVVRGHYAVGFALDDAALEGFEVDLAYRLLVCPDRAAVAVALLIVEHHVLCENYYAALLQSARFRREHLARDEPVLAVILEVSTGERRTVYARARTVYRGIAGVQHLHAERVAYLIDERQIPRTA